MEEKNENICIEENKEAGDVVVRRKMFGYDYFPTASGKEMDALDNERTLDYLIWVSTNYKEIDDFVEYIKNMRNWMHKHKMGAIWRFWLDHINVDVEVECD